jgi:hypothetical protein
LKRIGLCLALAACILFSGNASASETTTPSWVAEEAFEFKALGGPSSTSDPDEAADQIQALEAAHQAKISTPAAEAERQLSIDAFTDLGALAAAGLAIEAFEAQLEDLTTLATDPLIESEAAPVFLSDTSVRINPPGQEDSSLLVSSIPLRNQQGEPVSGALTPQPGGFAPLSPLDQVEFPATGSGEITFPDDDISFEFEDAESTQGSLISAGNAPGKEMVFYPNTAPDTDTAITYILGGIESFNFLRSEASPETLTLNYTLPEGATLAGSPDGGAAATDQDGETLLTVYPPYAVDAQGSFVPMSLTVEGDSILLNVPHRGEDFAYPIMVDPVQHTRNWWADGASAGYEGWSFHQSGTSNYASSNTCPSAVLPADPCAGTGAGVYTSGVPGSYYPADSKGYWRWSVPGGGTSSIQSAVLSSWRYRKGAASANNNPFAFFELTPGGSKTTTTAGSGGSNLALTGTDNSTRHLQVGLTSDSNMTLPAGSANWRYNRVGAFTANLTDAEPPELTLGQGPSGWIGPNTAFTVPATARDVGLGMGSIQAFVGSNWTSKWLGWCWGTYPYPCSNQQFDTALSFNSNSFASGINTVPVKAVDVVGGSGHEVLEQITLRIDRSPPTLSAIAPLEPGGHVSVNGDLRLNYHADDSGSGVKSVIFAVDEEEISMTESGCLEEEICSVPDGFSVDLSGQPSGYHEWTVRAIDNAGNIAELSGEMTLDPLAGDPTSSEPTPILLEEEEVGFVAIEPDEDVKTGTVAEEYLAPSGGPDAGTLSAAGVSIGAVFCTAAGPKDLLVNQDRLSSYSTQNCFGTSSRFQGTKMKTCIERRKTIAFVSFWPDVKCKERSYTPFRSYAPNYTPINVRCEGELYRASNKLTIRMSGWIDPTSMYKSFNRSC